MANRVYPVELERFRLDVKLAELESPHYYSTESGHNYSTFIFILDGSIEIASGARSVSASSGELFVIPPKTRCRAVWSGADKIRFYSLHLTESPAHSFAGDFALMKLPDFSNKETLERIETIFSLMSSDESAKLRAVGLFILLWCDVSKKLELCPHQLLSQPLRTAVGILEREFSSDLTIEELAARAHISQSRLFHLFRSELGQTPVGYRNELRISEAARLLTSTDLSVSEIAYRVGFATQTHFRKTFLTSTGLNPLAYRRCASTEM